MVCDCQCCYHYQLLLFVASHRWLDTEDIQNVLSAMNAIYTYKKCKKFVGTIESIDPLNNIAADNRMFPAGVFLTKFNGWLFHKPQRLLCCLMLMKVPICSAIFKVDGMIYKL